MDSEPEISMEEVILRIEALATRVENAVRSGGVVIDEEEVLP